MRFAFFLFVLVAVAAFWGARSVEGAEPHWRLVRVALYTTSGIFAGLFLSAAIQALLASD
jgi:hypothetical protein